MKIFRILAVVLAAIASAPVALAGDINGPAMAGLVLNNTIPDGDLYGLSLFAGFSTDVLNTNTTDTTTGFSQTMAGTYAGQALSVSYTGNSTAFPGGAITWTSTGTYGADTWTGGGSASFTFPTASTFQVAYSSSLILTNGTNTLFTLTNNSTIYGADNGTSLYYTGTSGTLVVDGVPVPAPSFTEGTLLVPIIGEIGYDDYEVNGMITITSIYEIDDEENDPNYPYSPTYIHSMGTINLVPEPSSFVLAAIGGFGLLVNYALRRTGKMSARLGPARLALDGPIETAWTPPLAPS